MRGNELIKKVEMLAKEKKITVRLDKKRERAVIRRFISENGRPPFATRRTN